MCVFGTILDEIRHRPDHDLAIRNGLAAIERNIQIMSDTLASLTAQVKATDTTMAAAVVLIEGIAARIAAAGTDPAALAALVTDLNTNTKSLSDAVAADAKPPATAASGLSDTVLSRSS